MTEPACSAGVEEFYRGKNISLIIGYSVGGGYDLYGRLVARHMGKHIPGRPTIIPQNLTGAGSLRAASFLYSAAAKDGTVFGTFGRTIATTPLLTPASAQFDASKFAWLGSITNEVSMCITWHTSPVKVWKDSLEKQITLGGEGTGADPDVYALLSRPFAAPPGIPADRKSALVTAFEQTMRDPEFLAEAEKLNMDVNPLDSKRMEHLIAELYATPRDVVEKAAQAIAK